MTCLKPNIANYNNETNKKLRWFSYSFACYWKEQYIYAYLAMDNLCEWEEQTVAFYVFKIAKVNMNFYWIYFVSRFVQYIQYEAETICQDKV